jgi:hypothetical protein
MYQLTAGTVARKHSLHGSCAPRDYCRVAAIQNDSELVDAPWMTRQATVPQIQAQEIHVLG